MDSSSIFRLEKIGRFSMKDLVCSSLFLIAFRGITAVGGGKVFTLRERNYNSWLLSAGNVFRKFANYLRESLKIA
jgi:hypothetical protein